MNKRPRRQRVVPTAATGRGSLLFSSDLWRFSRGGRILPPQLLLTLTLVGALAARAGDAPPPPSDRRDDGGAPASGSSSGGSGSGVVGLNLEVQKRIHERIEAFANEPRSVTGLLTHFHANGVFGDRGLRAADRDAFLLICYGLMLEFVNMDMIYVGLEDGIFMGHHESGWGTYREPGESGYDINNDRTSNMTKLHYRACVESYTGAPENCTLTAKYSDHIRCDVGGIGGAGAGAGAPTTTGGNDDGGCPLVQCPDEDSQKGCVASIVGPGDEKRLKCGSEVKWCRRYEHVESLPDDGTTLGYVPRTYYCHDENGAFTSSNCYFGDGVTPVNRSHLIGDYAYCGGGEGGHKPCSGTFLGGYRSKHYDPRWRGWYKRAKERQRESWSAPYPFFTGLDMGITFMQPIYTTRGEGDDAIREFHGVVAADYSFDLISSFLREAYNETSISVVIYEEEEPSYVIGTSTGSQAARKVLSADESKPCPKSGTIDECKAVRVPVSELSGHPMDSILVRAYYKQRQQEQKNFPDGAAGAGALLTVTATGNDIGAAGAAAAAGVYVVHSWIWEQSDSPDIKWRILVTMPSTVTIESTVERGKSKPLFGILCFVGSLGFAACLALFGAMFVKRGETAVRCADFVLTETFIAFCILLNTATFTLLGPNTNALCLARIWVFNFFFVAALSMLLVKVWRIHTLLKGARSYRRVQITHGQAAVKTLPLITIQVLILVVFTFVDPPKETIVVESVEGIVIEQSICGTDTNAFFIAQLSYDAILVLFGCALSYRTRNLDPKFGEAKQLLAVLYNTAFVGMIIVVLVRTLDDTGETSKIVLKAMGIFWGSVFGASAFVVPRLIAVRDAKRAKEAVRQSIAKTNRRTACLNTTGHKSEHATSPEPLSVSSGGSFDHH